MTYRIEICIRTEPNSPGKHTQMVESAQLEVQAETYKEAMERTFVALKTCNTFQEFMDKLDEKGV